MIMASLGLAAEPDRIEATKGQSYLEIGSAIASGVPRMNDAAHFT